MFRYELERWRKSYVRLPGDLDRKPLSVRGLFHELNRTCGDDGVCLTLAAGEDLHAELAVQLRVRDHERDRLSADLEVLISDKHLSWDGHRLVIVDYFDAQKKLSPDAAKKARQRARQREDPPQGTVPGTVPPPVPGDTRRDETTRNDKKEISPPARAHALGGEYLAHIRALVATNQRGGLMAQSGLLDAVAALCAEAARLQVPPVHPEDYATAAVNSYDAYRASCSPGKVPGWDRDGFERHFGRVQRIVAGTESVTPWQAAPARHPSERAEPERPHPPLYKPEPRRRDAMPAEAKEAIDKILGRITPQAPATGEEGPR